MTQPFVATSAKQLRTLASPVREEIIDAVSLIGPCTVTEMSRFLVRSRHALYYHVRALHRAGLLLEMQSSAGKAVAQYDLPGRPFSVRYDLTTPGVRRAVIALAHIRLRSAARGFVRACDAKVATTHGTRRNLWVTHWKGWLSDRELEEVNTLLMRLVGLLSHEPGQRRRRRAHELTFALAPVVPRASGLRPTRSRRG